MKQTILTFLSAGGFKLLLIGFFFVLQFLGARAKIAKKREADLRRGTGAQITPNSELQTPIAAQKPIADSPWSNLDAFDGRKP